MKFMLQCAVSLLFWVVLIRSGSIQWLIAVSGWLVYHTIMAFPVLSTLVLFMASCWIFIVAYRSLRNIRRLGRGR